MTDHSSRWFVIDQARINSFADVTEDHAPIHVDPEAQTPFGGTIAHGFLTLSMLSSMAYDALPKTPGIPINYGFDRVRFVAPVPSDGRVRAHFTLAKRDKTPAGMSHQWDVEIEIEGGARPAIVATWLTRHLTEPAEKARPDQ